MFIDYFDDATRAPEWTDVVNNGSIVEADGKLTLAFADTVHADFWGATEDGPVCTVDSAVKNVVITTKLNSYTVNNRTRAGLYITDAVAGTRGIHFGRTRRDEVDPTIRNGLTVADMGVSELAYAAITTLPIWLRVTITGSGVGSTMSFSYSINARDWFPLYTLNDETWSKVGLLAWNWNPDWSAIAAPFEFFYIEEAIKAQVWLGPTGNEVLLPTIKWMGNPPSWPVSTKKRVMKVKTSDGSYRWNFQGTRKVFQVESGYLTNAELQVFKDQAAKKEVLNFYNLNEENLNYSVVVTAFNHEPVRMDLRQLDKYKASMILEEV